MFFILKLLGAAMISCSAYALSSADFPTEFSIKSFPCQKQCFELLRKDTGAQMGVLVPAANQKSTYVFKDAQNEPQIIIQFAGIHWAGARYFNTYNNQGHFLGRFVEDWNKQTHGSKFQMVLFELDGKTIKAHIKSNLRGTYHAFYKTYWSPFYNQPELAKLKRPLFSFKTDSEVTLIDQQAIFEFMDPNLFAALLAFDAENQGSFRVESPLYVLQTKVKNLAGSYSIKPGSIDLAQLQSIASLLNTRFEQQYHGVALDPEYNVDKFINFACDVIASHTLSPDEEKAALEYLKKMMMI